MFSEILLAVNVVCQLLKDKVWFVMVSDNTCTLPVSKSVAPPLVVTHTSSVAPGKALPNQLFVVNQFESNLIYPLIVKKVVGVPPLLVVVALIAGYTLAGFLGALLSVPVSAVVLEIISDFDKRKRRIERKNA